MESKFRSKKWKKFLYCVITSIWRFELSSKIKALSQTEFWFLLDFYLYIERKCESIIDIAAAAAAEGGNGDHFKYL